MKIKNFTLFLIWAGAAISIAEIYTGSLFAPLGLTKGLLAILIGHIIGTLFFSLGGLMSYILNLPAIKSTKVVLGNKGTVFLGALNILQLIGWTAVMIIQSAKAFNGAIGMSVGVGILFVGISVLLWSLFFESEAYWVNNIAVILLFILTIGVVVFLKGGEILTPEGSMSFVDAIELAVAMPVSWLPLVGDYTINSENRKSSFMYTFLGYFIASCFMYFIGLFVSLKTGGKDIISYFASIKSGFVPLLIILLSTVTTTFMDVYSAAISTMAVIKTRLSKKELLVVYSLIGIIAAYLFPIDKYQNFLYAIGSVFIPVYTVVFVGFFILKYEESGHLNIPAAVSSIIGIITYNYMVYNGTSLLKWYLTPTITTIFLTALIYTVTQTFFKRKEKIL
ncbi:putative hydroxymethylpyrimidine transporter CytX [Thermoanaerobacter uzonensis DSM 18761]|jgi:putative hydroxymethylpyrimidine transporter CytX|uniref:Putative hydroxymethylpyrimidine transporter CytX n=1 Tax=Thermoanaerobacter uzonensis DSM 18761 TaxID=1123369 RepID=A0A1M4U4K2_9THEO|nr:putative hydroxymethylpyrimidine transporter CytX [Thermoanaerobacter uzonensis]SHE51662.1 putative hydroxymethylpyrimidine transporter CytX [Thermoanaerobacter uzonensis DSM 18761]